MLLPLRMTLPAIEPWIGMIAPSEMDPCGSGLYKIVTRNSPLSASGNSNAQKSHRITLNRFVESASTKRRRSNLDVMLLVISRSKRNLIALAPQRLFVHVALNRDSGDVAGVFDQLQVVGARGCVVHDN